MILPQNALLRLARTAAIGTVLTLTACSGGGDPAKLTTEGIQALSAGRHDEALSKLQKATQGLAPEDPQFTRAHVNLCRAKAYSDAQGAVDSFLELATAHSGLVEEKDFEMIVDTLRSEKQFPQAVAVLGAAMKRYPESPKMGALLDKVGKDAEKSDDPDVMKSLQGLGYAGD